MEKIESSGKTSLVTIILIIFKVIWLTYNHILLLLQLFTKITLFYDDSTIIAIGINCFWIYMAQKEAWVTAQCGSKIIYRSGKVCYAPRERNRMQALYDFLGVLLSSKKFPDYSINFQGFVIKKNSKNLLQLASITFTWTPKHLWDTRVDLQMQMQISPFSFRIQKIK